MEKEIQFTGIADSFDEIGDPFIYFELDRSMAEHLSRAVLTPHRHAFHEIIWLRQGSATHLLDGDLLPCPAQTLLVVPKGRIHSFHPSGECSALVIRFAGEFLLDPSPLLFSQIVGHRQLHLDRSNSEVIESYFAILRSEHASADPYNRHALRYLLAAFIARLEEFLLIDSQMCPPDFTNTLGIWNRLNALIEQQFKKEHQVGFYAAELGVSSRKLGEVVKLYTGRYFSDIIDLRLVTEAKRLILFSGSSFKEIAFALGFENQSYFGKVFRKITGKTPTDFWHDRSPAQNYQTLT